MKKKILLLSDDLRMTSGVSTMSREIVLGTVHKYDWIQVGAAINHPEFGKVVDVSQDIANRTGIMDAKVKIIPSNNYGDIILLRKLLEEETPDAILHFTDPHYWQWLYDNEHEIRQQVPILFYHIWDDLPDPQYNRDYYESCDWIGCISRQTYGIVNRVGKRSDVITFNPLQDWQIDYVPHGVNPNIFKPLDNITPEVYNYVCRGKEYDFILFFNNRNIRRKQPSDVMYAYKLFCDQLPYEKAKKCLLFMQTAPVDENGTDLIAVKNDLCPQYDVFFGNARVEQSVLNQFYNLADCTINIANNEGFGLSTTESIMAGTPIIVNVTGGLQDQCGFNMNGNEFTARDYIEIGSLHQKNKWSFLKHGEWVIPIWPSAININGSPLTPYIFDDRVNTNDVVDSILKVYGWGRDVRKSSGLKGREWAMKTLSSEIMCNKMIRGIDNTIKNFTKRKKFNLYKLV
jgi:glycosyltransferase involved in cell wall biosynthesis